jgi:hypothetical protein
MVITANTILNLNLKNTKMKKIYYLLLFLLPITANSQTMELYQKSFVIATESPMESLDYQKPTFSYLYTLNMDTVNSEVFIHRESLLDGCVEDVSFKITDESTDYFNTTYTLYDKLQQKEGFLVISGDDLVIFGFFNQNTKNYVGFMGYVKNTL